MISALTFHLNSFFRQLNELVTENKWLADFMGGHAKYQASAKSQNAKICCAFGWQLSYCLHNNSPKISKVRTNYLTHFVYDNSNQNYSAT